MRTKEETNSSKKKQEILSWIVTILIVCTVFIIFQFMIGITFVSGNSMQPTVHDKDVLFIQKQWVSIEHGDLVVFKDQYGFSVIKRVIGLPNDTVAIVDGEVIRNDEKLQEGYTLGISNDYRETLIGDGAYFLLGDHRTPGESLDSRSEDVGLVTKSEIIGKVVFSIWPLENIE